MEEQASNWTHYYAELKGKTQSIRKSGVAISALQHLELDESWKKLQRSLKTIQDAPMEYEICASELARRMMIIENLKKSIGLIRNTDSSLGTGGPNKSSSVGSVGGSFGGSDDFTKNPMIHVSDAGLVQQQREQMKKQDMMILNIEQGVNRLHQKAVAIGDESKLQNRMLDDLDVHVDIATEGLREEAKHADEVKETGKVCYMYICAAVEIIVLFILILIMVMKPQSGGKN
jgi:hypothetical protein